LRSLFNVKLDNKSSIKQSKVQDVLPLKPSRLLLPGLTRPVTESVEVVRSVDFYTVKFRRFSRAFPLKGIVGRPTQSKESCEMAPWWSIAGPSAMAVLD
jgi:hypothetical protein